MTDPPPEQPPQEEPPRDREARHMCERLAVALAHSVGVIEALDFDPGLARATLDDYLAWHREAFLEKEAQAE